MQQCLGDRLAINDDTALHMADRFALQPQLSTFTANDAKAACLCRQQRASLQSLLELAVCCGQRGWCCAGCTTAKVIELQGLQTERSR